MIYDFPDLDAPIRQGDIFVGIPRVDVPVMKMVVCNDTDFVETDWNLIAQEGLPVQAIFCVRPVAAIVVTQDCDASRNPDITLCEIGNFKSVYNGAKDTSKPSGWVSIITQHARINLKWFYLPPDAKMGFEDKLAVDFAVTIRVPRIELEKMRHLRKGRLNEVADEHFRERISEFFRRYPYDEWYSLSPDELQEYQKKNPDIKPYPWQAK